MAVLLVLQAALPSVPQQVTGRIVRPGTARMDPVSDIWVVLHRVGPDSAGPLDSVRSDPRGRYSFKYARTGSEEAIYFVSASYAGIAYFTAPLPEGKVSGDDGEITVFDTTSGHVPVSVRGHHIVVSGVDANARRSVVEVYDISNDTSVTRVAIGDKPENATWRAHLIPGATDFHVTQGDVSAAAVSFTSGTVNVFAPIAPGLKQLSFSYSLPAKAFPLKVPSETAAGVYEILIEEKTGSVTGPNLKEVDPVTVDERNFRRFLASDMPENSLAVIDLPAPPPSRSIDPRFLVAITLLLGGTMIVALAQALRRR
ncbi:MAG TPA: hypothetical protein VK478_08355 [Gemmatimonadaceae bacterium]|nr:hypothetical protein [Gemmatimonadaceae bacterium]